MPSTNETDPMLGGDRFRLAFEYAPIGMAIVGMDYRFERVNENLCQALGYSKEDLRSLTFVDITHPDDVQRDKELAAKLFRGEIPNYRLEKRFITKSGKLVWLDLTAFVIRGADDQPLYGLAMVEDITERREADQALRTSEERYRSFVVNSSEAIWRFEIEQPIAVSLPVDEQIAAFYEYGYLAECNDQMARLYGRDRAEDILGARFGNLVPASDPTNQALLRDFVTNQYRLHNTRSIVPEPQRAERYFSSTVIGIVVNGFLMRVWGVQRDETTSRLAENKLKHSRVELRLLTSHLLDLRERERGLLARELHDVLGQSLTSLKLDLARVTRHLKGDLDDQARAKVLSKLSSASELIERTIAQVKVISTELRPGVLDKFGLLAAVEWQCAEFQKRSGINCECRLPAKDVSLPAKIATALFRLLQEALTNVARHSGAANVLVTLQADETEAVLSVRDDGRGITAAEISAPDSLGLLGMRERTEALHGHFSIEGVPGRTVMSARIPFDAAHSNDSPDPGVSPND